ncbi:MAG TPA: hypothetical protein VHS09_04315, partial [Polyangiaceae bacterium]|nr:hypothetical protein [Polyangiaceae bacterium]
MTTIASSAPSRVVLGAATLLVLAAAACGESPPPNAYMATPGGGGSFARGSMSLGEARLRPEVCNGMAENRPDPTRLDESALASFLQRQGFQTTLIRARADLVYLDVTNAGGDHPVRLRVAVLNDAPAAGADLHKAILEHGSGSWGVHRSNLAVLGPIGDVDQILEFAGKTKLACWGVLTVAGRD